MIIATGSGFTERLNGNVNKLKRGEHDNKILQQAYNEIQEVRTELLEYNLDSDIEARQIEDEYIKHFRRVEGVIVCNIAKAGASATRKSYAKHKRLTEDKVIKIKQLIKEGKISNKKIAEMFECSQKVISDIKNNRRWQSVIIWGEF